MTERYDLEGRLISYAEWAELIRKDENRIVAQEQVAWVRISTIWTGIHEVSTLERESCIYETVVDSYLTGHVITHQFYPSRERARAGHAMLKLIMGLAEKAAKEAIIESCTDGHQCPLCQNDLPQQPSRSELLQ